MATGSGSRSSADDAVTPSRTFPNWRFSFDGPATGAENMARDLALFEAAETDPNLAPVFRLYTWAPPCISLGFHQVVEDELDLEAVRRLGLDIIRRPTGGRAILHDEELTYAVVAATDDASVGGTLQQSHARISEIFSRALTRLGLPALLAGTAATATADALNRSRVSAPCFASATRTELLVDGRKILGSAQRRGSRAFLQHGSLLLGDGHLRLADCLRLTQPQREQWREKLGASTTTVPGGIARDVLIGAVRASLNED